MKKNLFRALAWCLCLVMLIPMLAVSASEDNSGTPIDVYQWKELYYEDHMGDTIESLTVGNDTVNKLEGKAPLNNLYDLTIVGEGYTPFADFKPVSKNLYLQGNHSSETTSKNVFLMDNNNNKVAGKGMYTVIPQEVMKNLNEFTISWITRCHDPKSGYAGLALFYDNAVTDGGIDYFGGYDNYTFVGYTGSRASAAWGAYSIYGGKRVDFAAESLKTGFSKNTSVYASVRCIKGEYEYNGVKYTAKIESYSDDQHVATSYAQWAEAPVMYYYENPSSRWSVQFTNLKLNGNVAVSTTVEEVLATAAPLSILGTSVRYIGDAGLRFYTELKKDSLYNNATDLETGVIMLENSKYSGELTVETADILRQTATALQEDGESTKTQTVDFTDSAQIKDKSFVARAYVKYTISGKDFYAYSPVEKASCARTAAKVMFKYADSTNKTMLDTCKTMAGTVSSITMMSFNVLVPGTTSETAVEMYGGIDLTVDIRSQAEINMYRELAPDVIGTQEVSTELQKSLWLKSEFVSSTYEIFGSDDHPLRTGGTGEEGMYILYKKERFEFVDGGTKYLSDTPDVPHSFIKEAADYNAVAENIIKFYPRKMVWVLLRDKVTGQQMAFATTHLAYTPSDTELDTLVRTKQAKIAVDLLSNGTLFDRSIPYAIVGDMNAKPNTESYNCFTAVMNDARYTSVKTAADTQGSLHGYKGGNTFIDHVFVSRDSFFNHEFEIVTEEYMSELLNKKILPSDHYAIMTEVTILPQ